MKTNTKYAHLTVYRSRQPAHPGAADDRYFTSKALDILTAVVSGMGLITAMLFLVTLC